MLIVVGQGLKRGAKYTFGLPSSRSIYATCRNRSNLKLYIAIQEIHIKKTRKKKTNKKNKDSGHLTQSNVIFSCSSGIGTKLSSTSDREASSGSQ